MEAQPVPHLSESILKHAKRKYEAQGQAASRPESLNEFLSQLTSPLSADSLPITTDTSFTLSKYFISSSHNTYLTGNQLWSKASTDTYKDVLKRRCRCVEVDVWDGTSQSPPWSDAEDDGDDGKLNTWVRKGLTKIRSRSNTQTTNKSEAADTPGERSVNFKSGDDIEADRDEDTSDVKKLTGMMKKGLTRLRSGSNIKEQSQPAENSPAGDTEIAPIPWRTQSEGRNEPRVLHGHTATKEVAFRDVCRVIRDYAFRSSDLPLIVSLEVHCDAAQQQIMVEIMNDYWKPYLISPPAEFSDDTPLPSLEGLKKKILIKVKYTAPKKAKAKEPQAAEFDSSDE